MLEKNFTICSNVFCTTKGKPLISDHVRHILTRAYKREGFQHVSGNTIRRMASTTVAMKAPHKRLIVAKHMCHSTTTAERDYAIFDKKNNAFGDYREDLWHKSNLIRQFIINGDRHFKKRLIRYRLMQ